MPHFNDRRHEMANRAANQQRADAYKRNEPLFVFEHIMQPFSMEGEPKELSWEVLVNGVYIEDVEDEQLIQDGKVDGRVVYQDQSYNPRLPDKHLEVMGVFEVCPTCNGKGRHVNPSIDDNGISAQDFYEDPEFKEEYFGGLYDVQCSECFGNRVVASLVKDGEFLDEGHKVLLDKEHKGDLERHYDNLTRWYESGCPR